MCVCAYLCVCVCVTVYDWKEYICGWVFVFRESVCESWMSVCGWMYMTGGSVWYMSVCISRSVSVCWGGEGLCANLHYRILNVCTAP